MGIKRTLVLLSVLMLLQCRSVEPISIRKEIDRLSPDERILQAERFYEQNNKKWAMYAWNQTRVNDLVDKDARESYRLLKNWLFSRLAAAEEMQVSAMYSDYDDLWLGSWNGGVHRLSLSSKESFVLEADKPSLIPKVVYRIRKSGNAFWFATHQGLRYYNYLTGIGGWLELPGVSRVVSDFLENSEGLFIASLTG
ncbi:MAG: hypothetical protein AAF975_08915, partial [Spirochaetota bacterium]